MGEIFRRDQPQATLEWTGERLVSGVSGAIESEHLHRYFLARDLCRNKDVLDVASGEGYGSALIAQTAANVIGVELDQASVDHAAAAYRANNLKYLQGSATQLPLTAASVDVVVSFETLEHFFDHETFFAEVKRVLRPGGLLIVSTPDTHVYSNPEAEPNPYHVRELTNEEFTAALKIEFKKVAIYRQRVLNGSAISPDTPGVPAQTARVFEQRDGNTFEAHAKLPHAPYLLGLASNVELPMIGWSLYMESPKAGMQKPALQVELERLREVESTARQHAPLFEQAVTERTAAYEEIQRLKCVIAPLQVELERLRGVDAAARSQGPVLQKALAEAAASQAESTNLKATVIPLRVEIQRLLAVEQAAREQSILLEQKSKDLASTGKELQEKRDDLEALQKQLESSNALLRQQTLVVQRLQATAVQLSQPEKESEPAPPIDSTDTPPTPIDAEIIAEAAVPEKLLIPLWARRMVPGPLKPPLRVIKRAIRSKGAGA